MDKALLYVFCVSNIIHCHGVSFQDQLEHIFRTKRESLGLYNGLPTRRIVEYNSILGAPSLPSHLPAAETILPGHTLIRPALGMLKSSIKFPHKDLENGAGVYGNINNLGITYYPHTRVMYSGFRRALNDYIMVSPSFPEKQKPKYVVQSVVLDLDEDDDSKQIIQKLYELLRRRNLKKKKVRRKKLKKFKKPLEIIELFPSDSGSDDEKSHRKPKKILRNKDKDTDPIEPDPEWANSSDENNPSISAEQQSASEEKIRNYTKTELFYQTQDMYNHVKFSPEALNHEEYLPIHNVSDALVDSKNIRNWWFYHQDDFEPFVPEKETEPQNTL